jgi:hypothetical protein
MRMKLEFMSIGSRHDVTSGGSGKCRKVQVANL